jgi:hypothetical protein
LVVYYWYRNFRYTARAVLNSDVFSINFSVKSTNKKSYLFSLVILSFKYSLRKLIWNVLLRPCYSKLPPEIQLKRTFRPNEDIYLIHRLRSLSLALVFGVGGGFRKLMRTFARTTSQQILYISTHSRAEAVTRWRSCLRCGVTSPKVVGSIPDGIIGIFHLHDPFGGNMTLGSTHALTESCTRNISCG